MKHRKLIEMPQAVNDLDFKPNQTLDTYFDRENLTLLVPDFNW